MTALLDVQPTPSRIRPRGHASPAQLVRDQIRDFLLRHLRDWTPDFIVVCERKGTAIMRALIENLDHPLDWPWPKVISTAAIGTLPPGFFKGVRVLVFDDMLRYGRHVSPLVDQLNDLGASPAQIRIVVYAAHEGAPSRLSTKCLTFDACLRRLTSDAYYRVRDAIKAFLQQSGSLMLDTEHLEVRFTLKGSFQQLLESLRRRADATVFHSLDYRANITVYYGEDSAYALPAQLFPSGTELTGIVKKCRVVQRSWNEFAIIPICLPSVSTTGTWELPQDYQRIFKKHYEGPGTTRFYSAALLGSLFPLQWVIRDLYASDEDLFSLSLPKGGSTSTDAAGSTTRALRASDLY